MDTTERDSQIVQAALLDYARDPYAYGELEIEPVFDHERRRYLLMVVGWQGGQRVHGCLLHIDLIGDRIWIQRDGTEEGIATMLIEAGIERERIVLGFHPVSKRPLTGFAVA
jgi:hypothetical protein